MPASEIDRANAILGRPARLNKPLLAWMVGPNKIDYNYLFLLMIWRREGMVASRPQRRLRRCLIQTHCPTHGLLIDLYRILCTSFFSSPGIGTKSLYLGAAGHSSSRIQRICIESRSFSQSMSISNKASDLLKSWTRVGVSANTKKSLVSIPHAS